MIPLPMTPAWEFLNVVELNPPATGETYRYIAYGQYTTDAMRQLTHVKY
jgi:hypothetical protein